MIDLRSDLTDIANRQLSKKTMGSEVNRQLKSVKNQIAQSNQAAETLSDRLTTLQKTISSLERNSGIYEREILKLRGQMNDLQRQLNSRPLSTEKLP